MEFPRFVFRCPGAFQRAGGSYGYLSVADEEAHAKAIDDGWFATLPDAIEAHDKPAIPGNPGNPGNAGNAGNAGNPGNPGNAGNAGNAGNPGNPGNAGNAGNAGNGPGGNGSEREETGVLVPVSDAPPSRAELEQKAKELGLKFDGRTTDKKLAALIAAEV